jgi:type III secretion protein J
MNAIVFPLRRLAMMAMLVALLFALAGCKVGLYSNLTEQEANEMVAALTAAQLSADKERLDNDQWQVLVDKGELATALELLRTHGLPHDRYASMGEVFRKQGLVSTPSEERMRYIYAMSQELSQTLRKVDGVITARVHVVIPANDPLSDKIRPSSAAVFIKHRADVDLRMLTPAVKDLVAHSIEGLSHEQVSLSLFEARPQPSSAAAAGGALPRPGLVFGVVPAQTAWVLLLLLLAAAACLVALPGLLRRQQLDWRTWVRRQVLRR